MLKPIFLLTLLLSLPSWGSSWGMPSKAVVSQMAVACYSGGKVIFQDESISDFIKPTMENQAWTFIIKSKKVKIHVTGNCIVYEADKNSNYPMPVSNEEVTIGKKTQPSSESNDDQSNETATTKTSAKENNDIIFVPSADSTIDEPEIKARHGEKIIKPQDEDDKPTTQEK